MLTRFAWDRDFAVFHPTLKFTIQYKMLEDIYSLVNSIELESQENIKQL